jgi:predicted amidophosphoribosyltransferase
MRNRHLPRLCRSCGGPMARQEDTCWRCGARCADEPQRATQLRVVLPMLLTPDGAAAAAGSGGRR